MSEGGGPVIEIKKDEARYQNEMGNGIFHTWNEYDGTRLGKNVKKITAWAIDIDGGDKNSQTKKILKSPLVPSSIVETKNGFHVYFPAHDATIKNFKSVMLGLQKFFGSDLRALDSARILRTPGYYHQKDPKNKFLIEEIFSRKIKYREQEMLEAFGAEEEIEIYSEDEALFLDHGSSELWDMVYQMNCKAALEILSGTPAVNGEKFSFHRTRSGFNIVVDGKSTSCWIDRSGRIGAKGGGGPTIYRWILWYTHDKKKAVEYMQQYFPNLPWGKRV